MGMIDQGRVVCLAVTHLSSFWALMTHVVFTWPRERRLDRLTATGQLHPSDMNTLEHGSLTMSICVSSDASGS